MGVSDFLYRFCSRFILFVVVFELFLRDFGVVRNFVRILEGFFFLVGGG